MSGSGKEAPSREELVFSHGDVAAFAAASGDRNPLHLDPAFARRTPFGECVVHGALAALTLAGRLPARSQEEAHSLRAWFAAPVFPDVPVRVSVAEKNGEWEGRLSVRGKTAVRIVLSRRDLVLDDRPSSFAPSPQRLTPAERSSCGPDATQVLGGPYAAATDLAALARRLGAAHVPWPFVVGLAWASYVVGMELPGLHGLFTAVTLGVVDRSAAGPAGSGWIRVEDFDARTGLLVMHGVLSPPEGDLSTGARIESFMREPIPPPAPATRTTGRGPARVSAVVVGASRGLGASLSLELLSAGYAVHGLYSTTQEAAAELQSAAGEGELWLHRIDARDAVALQELVVTLRDAPPLAGLVLSAAPPPVGLGLAPDAVDELAAYVGTSVSLGAAPLAALLASIDPQHGWVLFCSSTALAHPPRDWPHYVAAKGALEGLARWTAAAYPGLRTIVARLPKLRTDLTNSPGGRIGASSTAEVAHWIVERLEGERTAPGLSILEVPGRPAESRDA